MSDLDEQLCDAVVDDNIAEVRRLLGRGASVNYKDSYYYGNTPLHKAAIYGYVEIAELLIRNKADVNAPDNVGDRPLHKGINSYYIQRNMVMMVESLIRLGANVSVSNNKGATPLHSAAYWGEVEVADLLIRNSADVNAPDKNGVTPLYTAATEGNVEIAELLIRNKADVNGPDNDGVTPLHEAATKGYVEIVELLIRNKADVNAPDKVGDSCLHQAAIKGRDNVVKDLVSFGADLSAVNNEGNSPLHLAVIYGKDNIVTTLITLGADPSARNNEGKTPIDIAEDMYTQKKNSINEYKYLMIINVLKGNSHNLIRTRQQSRVIAKTKAPTKDTMASPTTMQSKKSKENDVQLPWLVDGDEFQRMLSQGTFVSYENRLSLGGPCRAGKSTLASVLIDEEIPLKWNSTDGLVIFFGRNGIDIENKKMVPLKKGERGHEVFAKILRGEPDFFKSSDHETRQHTLALEELGQAVYSEVDTTVSTVKYTQGDNATGIPSTSQVAKKTSSQSIKPLPGHLEPQVAFTGLSTLTTELKFQKLQLQSSILEEIRNQKYKIKIAPSDLIDFGGQKSYDMTHQLFIQHKGSFLLMFDGRFGLHNPLPEYTDNVTAADIIKHWIDSVLTYIEDTEDIMPMIMFAATHRDQCKEDTDKMRNCFIKDIKSMFSNYDKKEHLHLETVYFINGIDKHDAEIQRMTDQVVQFAVKQTSWGQRRPMQWVPLELQISNMRMKNINIITKTDLLNVNQLNNDLALEGRQLNDFLLVQHSLGKLMFYNLPGLDNFIIIHPPALVNILRSFVTDEKFFPDESNLKTILLKLTTTGKISKTELLKLWEQHQFHQYMQDESIKEFVVQLLMHLDILVIPKASKQTNVYLVPCMIKSTRPSHFNSTENQEGNTICLRYTIARHSIPTSLAYKIIGASICAWPLKYEDNKPCLYHKAALVNISQDIELRIWIENNHVMVVMTNELALINISPDVAASVQECLTKNLESSLLFHYNSFGKQMKPTKASELYTMEVGIPCGQDVCYTSLQDVIIQDKWICGKEKNHDTRYLRYWTFNKSQTTCGPECKGLNNNEIRTEPSDKHLVRLGNQIGIKLFDEFFINLKMDRKKWESIEYTYAGHSPEGIMSMALVKWKECKLENMDDPTLNDLSEALVAVNLDTHAICQVFRENTKLQDIADFTLQETPGDDVLEELSKHIGNCALQLGIELGVSFHKLQSSFIKFPKDLPGLLEDILKIWKTESKVPTYHSLMMALSRVDGGGVGYLRKHCG